MSHRSSNDAVDGEQTQENPLPQEQEQVNSADESNKVSEEAHQQKEEEEKEQQEPHAVSAAPEEAEKEVESTQEDAPAEEEKEEKHTTQPAEEVDVSETQEPQTHQEEEEEKEEEQPAVEQSSAVVSNPSPVVALQAELSSNDDGDDSSGDDDGDDDDEGEDADANPLATHTEHTSSSKEPTQPVPTPAEVPAEKQTVTAPPPPPAPPVPAPVAAAPSSSPRSTSTPALNEIPIDAMTQSNTPHQTETRNRTSHEQLDDVSQSPVAAPPPPAGGLGDQSPTQSLKERAASLQAASEPRTVKESVITGGALSRNDSKSEQKLHALHERLTTINDDQKNSLTARFMTENSVRNVLEQNTVTQPKDEHHRHVDPNLRNSLLHAAQLLDSRKPKVPNKQIFKRKLVLLGYQEVGKTSLRKCFEADPLFFKKLPDVRTTTGVEVQSQVIRVEQDDVQLILSDFAGQEAYHSHTLFLTDRSIFVLVWKISAVEQDFQSNGISSNEEERLHQWIDEVYAKFPRAKIALIATHLDELRVQGQRSVEMILAKVEGKLKTYMESISVVDPHTGDRLMNEIVGNFAASCKTRTFLAAGQLRHLSGGKLSSLLKLFAEVAHRDSMQDRVYPAAAIPGRHVRLLEEVNALKVKYPEKLLLPLSELVHTAVRFGVESDIELLQVARLMHSWNILYLFNPHRIGDNVFLLLHPLWLGRLAAALFSYAHILRTPLHLRSFIGGLEYVVSHAEAADMHLMRKGFLRWPLVKVLFRQPLFDFMKREPDDADYVMCVQLLAALSLLVSVKVPCDDLGLLMEETPADPEQGRPVIKENFITRYFVPSLSPFQTPENLKRLAPVFFNRGVQVKFEFNMLPNEMWWRLQTRLQDIQQVIVLHQPRGVLETTEEEEMEEYRLQEADDEHNRWSDGMWLKGQNCRVFMYREGRQQLRMFSTESVSGGAEEVLEVIETVMRELLEEYQGLRREVFVACPEPECDGWHNADDVAMSTTVHCRQCDQDIESESIVVSGVGPRGARRFNDVILEEAGELLYFSLEHGACIKMSEYLGVEYRGPPPRSADESANMDGSDISNPDHVEPDLTRLEDHMDYMYALDKMVRAVLLRNLWDRVNEQARRRNMIDDDVPF